MGEKEVLTFLSVEKNQLSSFKQLSAPNLKILQAGGNQLSDISEISDALNALEELDLSGNQVSSLANAPALPSLTTVNLVSRDFKIHIIHDNPKRLP